MKLARKLYVFLVLMLVFVLSWFGVFSYRREVRQFETDMSNDARLLGSALASAVYEIWRDQGQAGALALIAQANAGESLIRIRWVWLDADAGEMHRPRLASEELAALAQTGELSRRGKTQDDSKSLYTYIRVETPEGRPGALELAEPLTALEQYTHASALRLILVAVALVLVAGLLMGIMGHRMIARPLHSLAEQARRIGAGDLSRRLELHGRDEITELSQAMNSMSHQLQEAHDGLIRETSARIETLEQLRHSERLATVGRLSAGMAHELGTPFNVVAGRAKLILSAGMSKEEIDECARIIVEQVERMTRIMRQLLDFARSHTSRKTSVDISQLVGQVLKILSPMARKQDVSLIQNDAEQAPRIAVDPLQMQQVLVNLVMNGIQAMPGGGRLEVGIRVEGAIPPNGEDGPPRDYLALRVEDEGDGIPAENLKFIFDPFFTTKEVGQGTGLGLSIAYGIVQEHRGWIEVESQVGRGSRFTMYLPMEESECADEDLQEKVKTLSAAVEAASHSDRLIGNSPAMRELYAQLGRIADTETSVLIAGESGTGKELVARELHAQSRRKDGPFVAINCAALPAALLESELFGHRRGAFTDARTERKGLFLQADGGTLLLDEVGEIPVNLQPKLLRALEERQVRPVGSDVEVPCDVRLIAATNRDLESAIDDGLFREDLFYRLNVIQLVLPPLRARGADVLLLAQHFLEQNAAQFGKPVVGISETAAGKLLDYAWPGNVRELRNAIERAVALTRFDRLVVEDLPEKIRAYQSAHVLVTGSDPAELVTMSEVERRYILHVLQAVGGNRSMAARVLGLDRKTLYRKLQQYESD